MLVGLIAVIGGALSGLQAGLNGRLGQITGTLEAVLISITTSFVVMVVIAGVTRTWPLSHLGGVPPALYLGGVAGLAFVFTITWVTPKIGVTSTLILTILGQLVAGMLLDHFGLLRDLRVPITPLRGLSVLLVVLGAYLSRM